VEGILFYIFMILVVCLLAAIECRLSNISALIEELNKDDT